LPSIALWFERKETLRRWENMHNGRLAAAALAALLATSTARGATVPPEAGKYMATIHVSEASGTECPAKRGDNFHGVFTYPGFTAKRIVIRFPVDFDGYPGIDLLVLTITSGAGTVKPRGNFLEQISAGPFVLKAAGSFAAVLTLTDDPQSFSAKVSEQATTVNCDAVLQIGLVRIGP
jgi:hypothetical protein